ncbi:putative protein kinase [Trypanosoma grayi]|uniref:putative protein kinase n=1 Tax=Trypanosoma grayi TaxID=71804 RepID=UPI0004F4A519|nr:putative protein kinase [Trypanosoma grayi]KEG14462.1 putative protein kinase [Trypanosoma grayi]
MATSHKKIVGKYELGRVLASGYFDCRTRLCTHIVTGAQYVVRIYDKGVLSEAQWMWDRTRDAIHVMRTLPKHENIIETSECFETQSSLYILMQYFSPTHITRLYTSETASGQPVSIPLQKTKHYYAQVVRGLLHMHNRNVVHLSIAPDHVMVNDRDQVKIGFLVSCTYFPKGKLCCDVRGTTHTVAPEVLRNEKYDPYLADAWSMGVLLYFMLHHGRYPHDGANTTKNILYHRIRPPDPGLSPDAKDLLMWLLHPVPSRRMRVEQILLHPFFASGRVAMVSTDTEYSVDPATGEDTLNIRIPSGLSRREEAAYIIQHTYRAYRRRKQLHHNALGAFARATAAQRRQSGMPMARASKCARRFLPSFPDTDDEVSSTGENTHNHQQRPPSVQQRLSRAAAAASTPLRMPRFDDPSKNDTPGSEALLDDDSPVVARLNGSFSTDSTPLDSQTPPPSMALEHPLDRKTSHFPTCTPSQASNSGLPPAARRSSDDSSSSTGATGSGGAAGEVKGATGRRKTHSIVVHAGREKLPEERESAATAAFLSNIKVDATRPCPVCNRLPTQRLGGREPYAWTPFVYKKGEFSEKEERSSDL